ncbi:MAG TPA: hypothetical protein VFC51_09455 [Chloroflexota bacterium]|nr:hypothetical protein [Chloroflexota bacterium]
MLHLASAAVLLVLVAIALPPPAADQTSAPDIREHVSHARPVYAQAGLTPGTPSATPTPRATPTRTETRTPTESPTATATATVGTPLPTPPFPILPPPPTATPTAIAPEEGGPTPSPSEPEPITLRVAAEHDVYRLSEQAEMPTIVVTPAMTGIPDSAVDDLIFTWSIRITYTPSDDDPVDGPSSPITYRWPDQRTEGLSAFTPDFGDTVRGGTLTMRAVTVIADVEYAADATVTILGTNPPMSTVQGYLAAQFPTSYYTLWRIAQAESSVHQFTDNGYPLWSSDGEHGVGMMQITYPSPTDDEVWSWKRNADAGGRMLQNAYATARGWPAAVAGSREFRAAVDSYNDARESDGLPRLIRVTVPDFTSGNFYCDLQQRERDAIRLYNGAYGSDNLSLPLHEYQLAWDADAGLLDLDVDEEYETGIAKWVRVEPDQRPRGNVGNDYVERVLARPPPRPC